MAKSMTTTSNSVFKQNQLVTLVQKTPKEHINTRPGRGGKQFKYVTTSYVQNILNTVFGWGWSFEVKDKGQSPDGSSVWVLGRLTVLNPKTQEPMIIKEQFGSSEIKFSSTGKEVDYADDMKAAASDSLKKAASLLGVCADLYADPETANEITKKAEQVKNILIEMRKKEQAQEEAENEEQIKLQEQE
jgi:hypothetical protein